MHQMEDSVKIFLVPDTESLTSRTKKSSELRECGMHRTKRWRPICSFHPDHALCLKIFGKMHLRCERGTLHVPKPKLNVNIYHQRFFTSLWEQQIDRVRKQLFLFIRALSKCIDSKWEYEDSETIFGFDGDVRSLLHHLFEHCGYLASHFLGTYSRRSDVKHL